MPDRPPALSASIAAAGDLTLLATSSGKPFAKESLGNFFNKACRTAGVPPGYSLHGLRKAFCCRWAVEGMTAPQIAAMSGHLTLAEVQRYIEAVNREALARAAGEAILASTSGRLPNSSK